MTRHAVLQDIGSMNDGGCSFWLIFWLLVISAGGSFGYGFFLGYKAHRDRWRDLLLYRLNLVPHPNEYIRNLISLIEEQLDIWLTRPDAVDTQFCEDLMATTSTLRDHTYRLQAESETKWNKIKPVWKRLEFSKVSISTCIEYDLSRDKMIQNLKDLHKAVRAW